MGFLWRRSASPGRTLSRILPTVIAASATPLFLVPAYLTLNPSLVILVGILVAGAVLLAADDVAQLVEPTSLRRGVLLAAVATATGAAIVGGVAAFTGMERGVASETRWALASATVLLPGFVAARHLRRPTVASQLGRTIDSIEVGVASTLPAFALMPLAALTDPPFLAPLVAWVVVVVALRVFAIRPMASLAAQTTMEREFIVDDSEAERRRIAGDIHDDVIQDLTMLVHHLDRDGAAEPAAVIRRAVGRLRAICADLRLPVLDDLGLGPALHALVAEVEPQAGGEIRLELEGEGRLPAYVELTLFRIAQEGLANAVKHGRPPIVVHLANSSGGAELQIDDSGPGIPAGVLTASPAEGHMGLLSMTQRAHQIGADLTIEARPGGGTRVRLVWAAQAAKTRSQVGRQVAN
jgi:signal transduction histidine kinase